MKLHIFVSLIVLLVTSLVLAACQGPMVETSQAVHEEFMNEDLVPQNQLVIPPQLEPHIENGEKVFDLTAQEGWVEIFPGKRTQTWGYGEQVYRGLAGLFILEDENSDSLPLPTEYGVDDIPLVIQDKLFDSSGQFIFPREHKVITAGLLGDTILVNGT